MDNASLDWSRLPREETDCILCGPASYEILSVQDGWPVVRCTDCGLVYLRERPSEAAVAEMYGKSYYDNGDVGYSGYVDTFRRYRGIFLEIFEKRHRDLSEYATGNRLLEVGCAHGFLLDFLRGKGWRVTGVDVSPLSSEYARRELGLDVHTGSVEDLDAPEGTFDVILLLDVLEHLHRPFDVLSKLRMLLAPGGILVVQCPWELYHWEKAASAILQGKKPGTIRPDAVPAHLYFFGPRTLDRVIMRGGFTIKHRQSGNYGAVKGRMNPPAIKTGNPFSTALRFVYFRMGVRKMLYGISRRLYLGNGLIRYATPVEDPPR